MEILSLDIENFIGNWELEIGNCMQKGVSLIELLVTISIIVLLLVAAIPAFRNYRNRTDLTRAADLIQSTVYETQSLALAPPVDKSSEVTHYTFSLDSSKNQCQIKSSKLVSGSPSTISTYKTYNLPNGVAATSTGDLTYSLEKQGKIIYPTIDVTITLTHSSVSDIKKVKVYVATGQVEIE